ncbi:hypothetical protein M408DRAFT_327875 [Serendipita vermifera MAFF 305830]|uniref:Uncharacterized protein n=1 Tax=Serendipita vermifera MAFF 305830 TaxID=933852 RepID=A0A0C3B297_SERVB|nr:hypothetical protein M408DRAFT_327875 [Serendipita vermifera MAFF 305830]
MQTGASDWVTIQINVLIYAIRHRPSWVGWPPESPLYKTPQVATYPEDPQVTSQLQQSSHTNTNRIMVRTYMQLSYHLPL